MDEAFALQGNERTRQRQNEIKDVLQVFCRSKLIGEVLHEQLEEFQMILVRVLVSQLRSRFLKCSGINSRPTIPNLVKNPLEGFTIVGLPREWTKFVLKYLVRFDFRERIEQYDAKNHVHRVLGAFFDYISDDILAHLV